MPEGDPRLDARSKEATVLRVVRIANDLARESRAGSSPAVTTGIYSDLERDLGLDSLGRAELLRRVEESFGVQLPPHALGRADTLRDIVEALNTATVEPVQRLQAPAEVAPVEAIPEIPQTAPTLLEALTHHARLHGARVHITLLTHAEGGVNEQKITYRDLHTKAGSVAAGLLAHGLERGDRVALMLPTSPDFFTAFVGVLRAGGVPVPIYPPAHRSQLEEHLRRQAGILDNCGARFLVTFTEVRAVAWLLRASVLSLQHVLSVDELGRCPGEVRHVAMPEDITLLQYTSGSTGEPKGVILSHANVLANIRAMDSALDLRASDLFMSWLPLYHDMGLIGAWLGCLYYAVPLVLMSPIDFLARPERWLHAITRYRATLSAGPNFAYEICATRIPDERLDGVDLRSWRIAFNGAEPVVADTIERFARRFAPYGYTGVAHTPVYGLAESAVGLTFPPLGRGPRIDAIDRQVFAREGAAVPAGGDESPSLRIVSCGRALPGYVVRVVDAKGEEQPERQEGRIEFRGPSATRGYFASPDATRKLFHGAWVDTGDMGYLADGELFVTGRAKDVIIRAGQHIHPQDAEAALGAIAGLRKGCVAVLGVADPRTGTEKLVILAETRESDHAVRDRLLATITQRVVTLLGAPPDDILLVPPHTILKTSSGKLRRAACRELYEQGLEGHAASPWGQRLRLAASAVANIARRAWMLLARCVYGAYAWVLAVAFGVATLLLLVVLPRVSTRKQAVRAIARTFLRAAGLPLDVVGSAHLAGDAPRIIAANHASYVDAVLLTAVLPASCRFVAKEELRHSAPMRFALERLGTRFVERFDVEQSVQTAHELVGAARAGESLVFFPEGTFTRDAGLRPFRAGAFAAAAAADVPIIPVVIRGTRQVLRDGQRLPRRHALNVEVLAPILPHGSVWADVVHLRDQVRAAILARCAEPDSVDAPPITPGAPARES